MHPTGASAEYESEGAGAELRRRNTLADEVARAKLGPIPVATD